MKKKEIFIHRRKKNGSKQFLLVYKTMQLCSIHWTSMRNASMLVYVAIRSLSVDKLTRLTSGSSTMESTLSKVNGDFKHLNCNENWKNTTTVTFDAYSRDQGKMNYLFMIKHLVDNLCQQIQTIFLFPWKKKRADTLNVNRDASTWILGYLVMFSDFLNFMQTGQIQLGPGGDLNSMLLAQCEWNERIQLEHCEVVFLAWQFQQNLSWAWKWISI